MLQKYSTLGDVTDSIAPANALAPRGKKHPPLIASDSSPSNFRDKVRARKVMEMRAILYRLCLNHHL